MLLIKKIKTLLLFVIFAMFGLITNSYALDSTLPGATPSDSTGLKPKSTFVPPYDVTLSLSPSNNSAQGLQHGCAGERLSDYQVHYRMHGNTYYFPGSSNGGGTGITIPYDGKYQITVVVYLCKNQSPDVNKEVDVFKNLKTNISNNEVQYVDPEKILAATVIYLNGPAGWSYHNSPLTVTDTFKKGDVVWLGIGPNQADHTDAVFTGGSITIHRVIP